MHESNKRFLIYLTSYLGVALIGGSIVHMGTLADEHSARYTVLGVIGLLLMIVGNVFEARINKETLSLKYLGIVSALAIATGFLSGGIQHFLDNPIFAGYLLAIGLIVAYVAFSQKYHFGTTTQGLVMVMAIGLAIIFTANTALHEAIPHSTEGHH